MSNVLSLLTSMLLIAGLAKIGIDVFWHKRQQLYPGSPHLLFLDTQGIPARKKNLLVPGADENR